MSKTNEKHFTQRDIDLMMWHHCNGMLTILDELKVFGTMIGVDYANQLAQEKVAHLEKLYQTPPSFDIQFSYSNDKFEIKKIMR